jgi:hypothetical protein
LALGRAFYSSLDRAGPRPRQRQARPMHPRPNAEHPRPGARYERETSHGSFLNYVGQMKL